MGFATALVMNSIFSAAATTMFVCFAEDPSLVARLPTELATRVSTSWKEALEECAQRPGNDPNYIHTGNREV